MSFQPFVGNRSAYDSLSPADPTVSPSQKIPTKCGVVCFDIALWRPGDIVLLAKSKSMTSGFITFAQAIYSDTKGANFTHAGIYAGDGEIWDLTRDGGVKRKNVPMFVSGRGISVRRPLDTDMQPITTSAINSAVNKLIAHQYFNILTPFKKEQYVCSSFVRQVLWLATGLQFLADEPFVMPSHFQMSQQFGQVGLRYLRAEK